VILYLIPVFVLAGLVLLLGILALLARIKGGRYLRPVLQGIAKVPLLRRLLEKMSRAAMQRYNPELASAMRKLERSGAQRDPTRAQQALSNLTVAERKAYIDAVGQQQDQMPQPQNRAERRAMEKLKKGQMPVRQQRRPGPR
jgi:hypothetical protein